MRRLLLLVAVTFFAQGAYAQFYSDEFLERIPDEEFLDTLVVAEIEFYPNIMDIFSAAREYSQDNNPYEQFLAPTSVASGTDFLVRHQDVLKEVEQAFGVSKEIIVAILRVESSFGQNTGSYQTVGVFLSILRFGSEPSRLEWARDELSALIRLAERLNKNPLSFRSSYAGAFGYPQFLPSSYLAYGVDGNKDGTIDLDNVVDAIWSIGNYLAEHGWREDPRSAVFAYNRSNLYVDCIFEYAESLTS